MNTIYMLIWTTVNGLQLMMPAAMLDGECIDAPALSYVHGLPEGSRSECLTKAQAIKTMIDHECVPAAQEDLYICRKERL